MLSGTVCNNTKIININKDCIYFDILKAAQVKKKRFPALKYNTNGKPAENTAGFPAKSPKFRDFFLPGWDRFMSVITLCF